MGYDDYRRDSGESISTRLTYLLIGAVLAPLSPFSLRPNQDTNFAATSLMPLERVLIVHARQPNNSVTAQASTTKRLETAHRLCILRLLRESAKLHKPPAMLRHDRLAP